MVNTDMCRFCLEASDLETGKSLFPLDVHLTILEMGNGSKVTVGDALKYIDLDVMIPMKKENPDEDTEDEEQQHLQEDEKSSEENDHPELPKSLCQECLDKLQSIYEFKYRVLENREYLKGYLNELAEAKLAEERAARLAIEQQLDIDLNNLDSLPDKLVLRAPEKRTRRPKKPRDPSEPTKPRQKRRLPDKSIIIAEDSQIDTAVYVRKVIVTPEKSPDQKHSSKRKSKHVVIEDIPVAEKPKAPKYERFVRKKEPLCDENNPNESNNSDTAEMSDTQSEKVSSRKIITMRDEEPVFEDDDDEEQQKRPKRPRK